MIKKIHIYDQNILLIDYDNRLWIMGNNPDRVTGFGKKNEPIYSPIFTGITLESDETVKKFYCYQYLLSIYTSKGNLWISRNLHKNKKRKKINNETSSRVSLFVANNDGSISIVENSGMRSSENSQSDDDSGRISNEDIESDNDNTEDSNENNGDGEYSDEINNSENYANSDNHSYFDSLLYRHIPRNSMCGIDLLEENVDEVTYSSNSIFFRKGDSIFIYDMNLTLEEMIVKKIFGLSFIGITSRENYVYYQFIFPFDRNKIMFMNDFVYILSGNYHHVFYVSEGNIFDTKYPISWIYFKSDLDINENDIYSCRDENSVYVKNKNTVYKYSHAIHDIIEFVDDSAKSFIIPTNDDCGNALFCIREDGVYFDYGILDKDIDVSEYNNDIVDAEKSGNSPIILVKKEAPFIYETDGDNIYFNVNSLEHYKLMDSGLIYSDKNTLFYCTTSLLAEHTYNTIEIEKIDTHGGISYYIYMFTNVPNPITDIKFTNHLILIESNDKHYYHTIDTLNFSVTKFTEIILSDNQHKLNLVVKNHIIRDKKTFESSVSISLNVSSNKFEKLLNIAEMFGNRVDYEIEFREGTKVISYGDGPKRELMETSAIDFSEKYLLIDNVLAEFNINSMEKFTDSELYSVGGMLHSIICHSGNHLPIRLPISLMCELLKKEPNVLELEYFAKIEDEEAFYNAHSIKNNIDAIKSTGFDSYEECLKFLCKYYNNPEKSKYISKKIATGFHDYHYVKNKSIMNFPTVDYYLSGDYVMDRNMLINRLRVYDETKNSTVDYKEIIENFIKNISENKLRILLKNWSGTSIIKKSLIYGVTIVPKTNKYTDTRSDIYFATCNLNIIISESLIKNVDTTDSLTDILTTPMNSMIDMMN